MKELSGGLLIDKPSGPTSHDVVQRLRRSLATRRIGHAGTLDPLATGLLVILIGEATKLEPYISSSEKTYLARVVLGRTTDTLDLEGGAATSVPVPEAIGDEIDQRAVDAARPAPLLMAALDAERRRVAQEPPSFSAIKVDGVRSHVRARAGETFVLPSRPVRVIRLTLGECGRELDGSAFIDVELVVSKGYYVRAFARDVGTALGTGAALASLRRTASGAFAVDAAHSPDVNAELLRSSLVPLVELARRTLPVFELTPTGLDRARHGKLLGSADTIATPPAVGPFALLGPGEEPLVAIAASDGDGVRVLRGFAPA